MKYTPFDDVFPCWEVKLDDKYIRFTLDKKSKFKFLLKKLPDVQPHILNLLHIFKFQPNLLQETILGLASIAKIARRNNK
jgi:hypothetical protein